MSSLGWGGDVMLEGRLGRWAHAPGALSKLTGRGVGWRPGLWRLVRLDGATNRTEAVLQRFPDRQLDKQRPYHPAVAELPKQSVPLRTIKSAVAGLSAGHAALRLAPSSGMSAKDYTTALPSPQTENDCAYFPAACCFTLTLTSGAVVCLAAFREAERDAWVDLIHATLVRSHHTYDAGKQLTYVGPRDVCMLADVGPRDAGRQLVEQLCSQRLRSVLSSPYSSQHRGDVPRFTHLPRRGAPETATSAHKSHRSKSSFAKLGAWRPKNRTRCGFWT
jgi:hypothetical protein